MSMQIKVNPSVFGANTEAVALEGAEKWPEFTWSVVEGETEWPAELHDRLWEAQQWLHDQVEAHLGHPVGAPAGEPAAPPAQGAQTPPPFEADQRTERVLDLMEKVGQLAQKYFQREPKAGVQFVVKAEAMREVLLQQALDAEIRAEQLERTAADLKPQELALFDPLPQAVGADFLPPFVPAGRKRKGASELEAGLVPNPKQERFIKLQREALAKRLCEDCERQQCAIRVQATEARNRAAERRFMAAALEQPVYWLEWQDVQQLFGERLPYAGGALGAAS